MAAPRRRYPWAVCFLCTAAIQIFGFVGQEVARQGQKQLEQEYKDNLAKEKEKEAARVRKAPAVRDLSKEKGDLDKKGSLRAQPGRKSKSNYQPAFVHPQRLSRQSIQARRAHASETNYFAMIDAMECIEEGCDFKWTQKVLGKLKKDERNILQSMLDSTNLPGKDLPPLKKLFRSVHDTRQQLKATLDKENPSLQRIWL